MKLPYLRSRTRRGRWFHTYKRAGTETSLGVHGLHPTDPRVMAAWAAAHARYEDRPPETKTPRSGTFAWAVDVYMASRQWRDLAEGTQKSRSAILRRYVKAQGNRPLSSITTEDLEAHLMKKGGFGAISDLKALRCVFRHMSRLHVIPRDPTIGVQLDRPKSTGFATATAADIEKFMERWPVGTVERLGLDLGLLTGAAMCDLVRLSRKNIRGDILSYNRKKTGNGADIPMTRELKAVIARTPDIAPAFLLNEYGRPFTAAGFSNKFGRACREAGVNFRMHGLRKAFACYWVEQGASTTQIGTMIGDLSLSMIAKYIRDFDRAKTVRLMMRNMGWGHETRS